jgi:hypothetical protein
VIAGIFLKPHPFEDGAFFFRHYSMRTADPGGGCFSRQGKVNSGGQTTLLWIKQVFGVCGELWLISCRFGFCSGLPAAILGSFMMVKRKPGRKNVVKTWCERGCSWDPRRTSGRIAGVGEITAWFGEASSAE